jgi:hypothetical protein
VPKPRLRNIFRTVYGIDTTSSLQGKAIKQVHRQDSTLLMVQNMIIVESWEDLASRLLRREISASFRLLVHEMRLGLSL